MDVRVITLRYSEDDPSLLYLATASQTTKSAARHRRSADSGRCVVVGTEACGFVRRPAVRVPSGFAAPMDTKAARGADTKTVSAVRRTASQAVDNFTRRHGDTEFLHSIISVAPSADFLWPFSVAPSLRVRYPLPCSARSKWLWRFVVARQRRIYNAGVESSSKRLMSPTDGLPLFDFLKGMQK